jgi:hypothetical protein
MVLPNFNEYKELLAHIKHTNQSWGDLFREISSGKLGYEHVDIQTAKIFLSQTSLLRALAQWNFYSSEILDQAASDYEVKSWQIIEYIEGLREELSITESDLIVYKENDSSELVQTELKVEQSRFLLSGNKSQEVSAQNPSNKTKFIYSRLKLSTILADKFTRLDRSSKTILCLTGLVTVLLVVITVLITSISYQKIPSLSPEANRPDSVGTPNPGDSFINSQNTPPKSQGSQVYFKGIDLPITNSLCSQKSTFCIYNLAALINRESGEATYSFSGIIDGQQVDINGVITISSIEKNGGRRSFTFLFRDDQRNTTKGWAAAGYFLLDQDSNPSRPGILTRFKTTESFGPKTPVGLENTEYIFPR